MSALTPPAEVRISPDARLLYRSMLIEDEKHNLISSDEYFMFDQALNQNFVFVTCGKVIENAALGSHYTLEVVCQKIGDPNAYILKRFPYYVRFDRLTAA